MSMELQRPRLTPVITHWDLDIVPEALSKPPYQPLREASLKHVTLSSSSQWLQLEDAVNSNPLCLICNIKNSNLRELVLHYVSPQSSCVRIRGETKSMTHGTFQRFRLLSPVFGAPNCS